MTTDKEIYPCYFCQAPTLIDVEISHGLGGVTRRFARVPVCDACKQDPLTDDPHAEAAVAILYED